MEIKEMSNVQLLFDYETSILRAVQTTSIANMKREKCLLDEIGKRLGMTVEEIEEVWAKR